MQPTIRIDDVLQAEQFSLSQMKAFTIRSPFEWFKLATKDLQDYPLLLSCLANKIDKEWADYIGEHPNWKIACHGLRHIDYRKIGENKIIYELSLAKSILEEEFDQEVTEFYPPRDNGNEFTRYCAELAGLTQRIETSRPKDFLQDHSIKFFYFHYWCTGHLESMKEIICLLKQENQ